ncbi:MAG: MBL fold metallo-hydrolase, partial [Cyanobacteriota bacterium]
HHGSRISIDEEYLNLTSPEVVIISANNKKHPHKDTINLLTNKNMKTYITGKNGAISIRVDESNYEINTFNKN